MKLKYTALTCVASAFFFAACETETTVEDNTEEVGDAIEDAAEDTEDAVEDAVE